MNDLPIPTTVAQLSHNVEQLFYCVAGEPRAYTRDPPLMLGDDQVTTEWIDRTVNELRTAMKAKDDDQGIALLKRLAANGIVVDKQALHWQRDQDRVEEDGPRYWYFTLGFAGTTATEAEYVEALWQEFEKLYSLAMAQNPGRTLKGGDKPRMLTEAELETLRADLQYVLVKPRLLWRRRIHFDTYVDKVLQQDGKTITAQGPIHYRITCRIAVPVLHDASNGIFDPAVYPEISAKFEGSDYPELPA